MNFGSSLSYCVWKALLPLVRKIPKEASNERVFEIAAEFQDSHHLPPFLVELIDQEDADFAQSLIAMRRGVGDRWLEKIAPLWGIQKFKAGA